MASARRQAEGSRLGGPRVRRPLRGALKKVFEAKQDGHAPPEIPEREAPAGGVVDLMAALEESVQKARATRGEGEADAGETPKKRIRKAPNKKAVAKKTAGRRPNRPA
ncbi:hypothetical protein ACFPH6_45980 [Streptomyces xiangluensis]|uniref:Uncharacterized protein n=1 Tax=Streptomyces xiangluensis TaxID=2665720 RepID=A0ABV8Z5Z9_9ACTN